MTYDEMMAKAARIRKLGDAAWEAGDKAESTALHGEARRIEAEAMRVAPREPMRHELKCWPEPFAAAERGDKHHEVRKNDRDYRVGDTLVLQEWVKLGRLDDGHYTGKVLERIVTYISKGPLWGLPEGICVMSIAPLGFDRSIYVFGVAVRQAMAYITRHSHALNDAADTGSEDAHAVWNAYKMLLGNQTMEQLESLQEKIAVWEAFRPIVLSPLQQALLKTIKDGQILETSMFESLEALSLLVSDGYAKRTSPYSVALTEMGEAMVHRLRNET